MLAIGSGVVGRLSAGAGSDSVVEWYGDSIGVCVSTTGMGVHVWTSV